MPNEPLNDPLWRELYAIEQRTCPRLEPRFGRCPICRLPAWDAVPFGIGTWAICVPCQLRWPVGVHVLEPFDDSAINESIAEFLADLDQIIEEPMTLKHRTTDPTDRVSTQAPMATRPYDGLTNAAVDLAARVGQRTAERAEAARLVAEQREAERRSDDYQRACRERLATEAREGRTGPRTRLDTFYEGHSAYVWVIAGQELRGPEIAARLREGADLAPFIRAQNDGVFKRERVS